MKNALCVIDGKAAFYLVTVCKEFLLLAGGHWASSQNRIEQRLAALGINPV